MKEIPEEVYEFVRGKEGHALGLRFYFARSFARSEDQRLIDLSNWLELGGKDGETVALDQIPQFLRREKLRLKDQPEEVLTELKTDIDILNEAEDLGAESGREAARRYFLRQFASQWYTFVYDPSLVMNTSPSPSEIIIDCSLKALHLISKRTS